MHFVAIGFLIAFLGACQPIVMGGTSLGIQHVRLFQNPDINLKAKNYAAVDYLVGQARTFLETSDTVRVLPLVNLESPETPAALDTIMSHDMAERLIQLGFPVDTTALAGSNNPLPKLLPPADFILSGTYTFDHPHMIVSLKITDAVNGRIRATFDYVMDTNRDIRAAGKPTPQIVRITR